MVAQVDERGYVGVLTPDADLRRSLFSDAVMRHPAKQHLPQLMHIARRLHDYGIEPMSNILDCFGGAGTAMSLCAPHNGGHNVVTIELAAHFRALQAKAWEHFSCTLDMADIYDVPPGVFVSLAGDSRQIPQVLAAAGLQEGEKLDSVITSPPYHDTLTGRNGIDATRIKSRYGANSQALIPTTYDAVITSPSYGGSEAVDKRKTKNTTMAHHGGGNLARLRYDKDELAKNGDVSRKGYQQIARMSKASTRKNDFGPNSQLSARVGNQQYAPENIGNESGNKYLASMAQVWQGAAAVLRPGGVLVCITRDCVKRGKRVPIGEQNRALIEAAGLRFVTLDRWHVDRLSFWRILQARKNPNAPIIDEEWASSLSNRKEPSMPQDLPPWARLALSRSASAAGVG